MNKLLLIPMIALVFIFAVVLQTNSRTDTATSQTYAGNDVLLAATSTVPSGNHPAISRQEAMKMVLDQWPVSESAGVFSRRMRHRPLEATLLFAELPEPPSSGLFASLSVYVPPAKQDNVAEAEDSSRMGMSNQGVIQTPWRRHPVFIDHATRKIVVFDGHRWHPYAQWRDEKIELYKKQSGWQG